MCLTNNSVAQLEACDIASDPDDFTSDVMSKNERVLDPSKRHTGALILQYPVYRIDRHGTILDDNLIGPWCRIRGFRYLHASFR